MRKRKNRPLSKAEIKRILSRCPQAKLLTKLEFDYLILYIQGDSADKIAEKLQISKGYKDKIIRHSIMQKFNVKNLILAAFQSLQYKTCTIS